MKRLIGPLIIILVAFSLTLIWFKNGLLIAGGESGYLLMRPDRFFDSIRYLWSANEATGATLPNFYPAIPFYYIASLLFKEGLSAANIQRMVFGILLLTGGLSMYFLTTTLLKNSQQPTSCKPRILSSKLAGLLAGLFYMLNPYAMVMVWHRFLYPVMFFYASLPLVLLFFIKGLNEKNLFYALSIGIISFIFSFTYNHPAFIVVFWIPLFTYAVFYLYLNRHSRQHVLYIAKFFGVTFVFWALINMWWLLPFFKVISVVGPYYISESAKASVVPQKQHSLYYLVRLLNPFYLFDVKPWGAVYSSFIFQAISWVAPVVILVGVVLNIRNRFTQYFALLSAFGLFLAKGANPPFGEPMSILFKIFPPMVIFRDFFGRFGIILPSAYAFLFGLGFSSIFYKIKNSSWFNGTKSKRPKTIPKLLAGFLAGILLLLSLAVYPWPMWTGAVWNSEVGDARVQVPSYYSKADRWLTKQRGDFRLLHLPLVNEPAIYNWNPNKFNGAEPSTVLFEKTSISRSSQIASFVTKLLKESNKNLSTKQLWKIMAILNTRYVVLHRDIDTKSMKKIQLSIHSPTEIQKTLKYVEKLNLLERVEMMPNLPAKKPESMGWELVWGNIKKTTGKWDPYERATPYSYALTIRGPSGGEYLGWAFNLPQTEQDWQEKTYLIIWLKSSISTKALQFVITDRNKNTLIWDGRTDSEYSIASYETNKWKCLVLPLEKPTDPPPKTFNFGEVKRVFVAFKTVDPKKELTLKIGSMALVPGTAVRNKGIHYVKTFGKLDIYELDHKYLLEHIYATNQYVYTRNFHTFFEEAEKDSFVPGDQIIFLKSQATTVKARSAKVLYRPKITYDKINSAKYSVRVKNAARPYFLVFSETYDPGWKAYVDGKEVKKHFITNGYANAYYINRKGTYDIKLEYAPLQLLRSGTLISLISFVTASLLVIVTTTIRRTRRKL